MSGACFSRPDGGIEYELRCDGCGVLFQCGDDSYFSWPVLCAAAEAEGWGVAPDLDGEHECGECAATGRSRRGLRRLVPA
ncbi:hypothetical protein [Glycomyces albidus]|jgi:hypothetical protein|uniref:Uncharacterized protein n=1 Tax=Glycomyces albidus TaxID=2656774 RepID=A0A6L5GB10_9ACTN|nr:hypothetical protein [Glycomyces albidus]MQM26855.1 hypothetical protein [Glycomyces albidus]